MAMPDLAEFHAVGDGLPREDSSMSSHRYDLKDYVYELSLKRLGLVCSSFFGLYAQSECLKGLEAMVSRTGAESRLGP